MPIVVNIDVMMARRKINAITLAERIDLTPANLSILKTGKAKAIRFSTLAALCQALECQPGDLLEYQADEINPATPARPVSDEQSGAAPSPPGAATERSAARKHEEEF